MPQLQVCAAPVKEYAFCVAYPGPLRANMTSSTKPEIYIAYRNAAGGNRAVVTGNICRKFRELRTSDCRDMLADRQTDKQTHTQGQVTPVTTARFPRE